LASINPLELRVGIQLLQAYRPQDAVENMLLAITALGYASVWLDGALREDGVGQAIDRLLGVPDDPSIGARVLLPVGVPAAPGRQNSRKPWAERVCYNRMKG
jgi:nitroreductase